MFKQGRRSRIWITGAVVVVVMAVFGGAAAAARNDRSGDGDARQVKSIAKSTTTAAAQTANAQGRGKKPRPGATTTTTTTSTSTTTTTLPPSTPGSDVKIPLSRSYAPGEVMVDAARGRVYVTGGKGNRDLIVTDLDGGNLRTLSNVAPGAAGMTLSPDGTKLYVAASDSDGITVLDTATYATSWYWTGTSDGTMTCPRDVAFAAGQLWFSWGCDNAPAGIGRVDLETGAFSLRVTEADGDIRSLVSKPALLATLPNEPNVVIAGLTDSNPAGLYRFEATSTRLVLRATGTTDGGSVRQMAVTPDGSQIIIPSGAPYYHQVFRTSDLTLAGRYQTTHYPNAVAIRGDGLVVAGTDSSYDKDVWVFEPGGSTPIATFEFGHLPDQYTWAHNLVNGGLAVHGNRIYAITEQGAEPDILTLRIRELE